MSRIPIRSRDLTNLLEGEIIEVVYRGSKLPSRADSHELVLQEPTDIRALVVSSQLRPRSKKVWNLALVLDRSDRPLVMNAESAGGVIVPLGEGHAANSPEAHGYRERQKDELDDAGEAIPHEDVLTSAASQEAAARFVAQKVDVLAKKRDKALGVRVQHAFTEARAHGVDITAQEEAILGALEELKAAVKVAA